MAIAKLKSWFFPPATRSDAWIPGRTLGGVALITAPVLWCLGLALRHLPRQLELLTASQLAAQDAQIFAAPQELALYEAAPTLVTTGYAVHLTAAILLIPAILALAPHVAKSSPRVAQWGAMCFIAGLMARGYHIGVEQTAFQLVDDWGLARATEFVLDSYQHTSYGPWRVAVWASVGQLTGTVMLVLAAFRTGVWGVVRCAIIGAWGMLWMGVLKESAWPDVATAALACLVLVPVGVALVRGRSGTELTRRSHWW